MKEYELDNEAVRVWLAAAREIPIRADAVRAAREDAAAKIEAAIVVEAAFNEAIGEAEAAHAAARDHNDAVRAAVEADEPINTDNLLKRGPAEQAARGSAFDVISRSEVVADLLDAAAEATRIRAGAEVAYGRALSASEMALDDVASSIQ